MEVIRKITQVKNNSISFKELEKLNEQEVIIFPLNDRQKKRHSSKKAFFKFEGTVSSSFTDTSKNIDKLIYGE